jgi:alanyl-tRNA synthetase
MTTRRLYYDDSFMQSFEARVVHCAPAEPVATAAGTRQAWEVVLDETAFYPTSGGQPHDLGLLGEAEVLDVRDDGADVVHIVGEEIGGTVAGCVNWPRRFDHMQQHTGQHLLSAMFQERFALPTVSFHLGAEICTIDLRGAEPSAAQLQGAQRAANLAIFENRPVNVRYGTQQELAQIGVRKQVEREGILRAIEIESADLQPCGGTHVRSTGQIGMILLRGCTKIRQDWRVEFASGGRAERLAGEDLARLLALSRSLTCAVNELPAAVGRVLAERDAHFKSVRAMVGQLAEARAAQMVAAATPEADGTRVIAEMLQEVPPELLLPLATEIAKSERAVALLGLGESGQLVFAQHVSAGKDLMAVLNSVLGKYPGKGGGSKDFVRAKLGEAGDALRAVDMARGLLVG